MSERIGHDNQCARAGMNVFEKSPGAFQRRRRIERRRAGLRIVILFDRGREERLIAAVVDLREITGPVMLAPHVLFGCS